MFSLLSLYKKAMINFCFTFGKYLHRHHSKSVNLGPAETISNYWTWMLLVTDNQRFRFHQSTILKNTLCYFLFLLFAFQSQVASRLSRIVLHVWITEHAWGAKKASLFLRVTGAPFALLNVPRDLPKWRRVEMVQCAKAGRVRLITSNNLLNYQGS